ncbi:hypothetical protein [Kocuria marina]|uniref:hypothetical protein n=1 Tax=Kocuria marina TaxID=223184 RepID=UPI0022DEBB8C|nr:hypothetical protein [Kocuria marina]
MGLWSKLALLAAGAVVGGAATRVASDPAAREAIGRQVQRGTQGALARREADGAVERRASGSAVELFRTAARRFQDFAARVRAGMNEREAELHEKFGVRTPVDHTANHPDAPHHAAPPPGAPWRADTAHEPGPAPDDPRGRIITHVPSEGNDR